MAIDLNTLFTRLGKLFYVQQIVNTFRGTTLPPEVQDIYDEFDSSSLFYRQIVDGLSGSLASYQAASGNLPSTVKTVAGNVIVRAVADDTQLESPTLVNSLQELIRQMMAGNETVDASTVGVTPSAITGNGDGVLVASIKRQDGRYQETALAETLTIQCTSDSNPATAGFTAHGETGVIDSLSSNWPAGSGITAGLTAVDAGNSLLANGGLDVEAVDDDDNELNIPAGWILSVGTAGTTIRMSNYEEQQLVVTGPPTAGTYRIHWQNAAGKTQSTLPLNFDATGGTLQAALRTLDELEDVEVETTGTSPNYTHTITFTGVAGNVSQITVTNNTTGGTYTPSTTAAGDALAYVGKSVIFLSNGSELTTLNRRVTLQPLKQYAFNCFAAVNSTPAAGVLTVDLVDGIGGSVIADQAGANNSFTISATGLNSTFAARNGVFRTPKVLPAVVYLRIRISTAVTNTTQVAIDHAALAEMTELYPGGAAASIFSGRAPFTASSEEQVEPDYFTLAVTNDRAGKFQDYFERNFAMAQNGFILPSDSGGTETQDDALIG